MCFGNEKWKFEKECLVEEMEVCFGNCDLIVLVVDWMI